MPQGSGARRRRTELGGDDVTRRVETVVVGGGPAGLATSYCLGQLGRDHVVLERGRVAERWRSERWDSFCLLSPNWAIHLPGDRYETEEPDGFAPRDAVVRWLEAYAARTGAPVREGVEVTALRPGGAGGWRLETPEAVWEADHVVVATGPYQRPAIPAYAGTLPPDIVQVPSSAYRNPSALPPGGVLVVGAGTSGCQITEDLVAAGRRVHLSVGSHHRVPRRYRGRDFTWWCIEMGEFDQTVDTLPTGRRERGPALQLTGVGGGHDIDLRAYEAQGVVLLGRLEAARDGHLFLAADLEERLARGDEMLLRFRAAVDAFVHQSGLDAPPAPPDALAAPRRGARAETRDMRLRSAGITSVVWACGFRYGFDWVQVPVFDDLGEPVQRRGVTRFPGLYFVGLPWLHKLKSSFLFGLGEDAAYVAAHIAMGRGSRRVVSAAGTAPGGPGP
jgi:putative flavoprotein involved in K+ transport